MIFLLIFFYFVLAASICAVLFLPPVRWRLLKWLERRLKRAQQQAQAMHQHAGSSLKNSQHQLLRTSQNALHFILRHRYAAIAMCMVLIVPPLIAIYFSDRQEFAFSEQAHEVNTHIASLLNGEHLVPPPPLPPEVFTTREVELARPLLRYASRNWDLLEEEFRQRLLLTFKLMHERHGYEMAIIEGYRSPERQAQLAAMGDHVTKAGAHQSYHQFGLAADCAFYRDGKLVISEKDPWAMRGYKLYGEIAAELGLTWGGSWKMMDFGHVELRRRGVLKRKEAAL